MLARLQLAACETRPALRSLPYQCIIHWCFWMASDPMLSCFRRRAVHIYLNKACNLLTTYSLHCSMKERMYRGGRERTGWLGGLCLGLGTQDHYPPNLVYQMGFLPPPFSSSLGWMFAILCYLVICFCVITSRVSCKRHRVSFCTHISRKFPLPYPLLFHDHTSFHWLRSSWHHLGLAKKTSLHPTLFSIGTSVVHRGNLSY